VKSIRSRIVPWCWISWWLVNGLCNSNNLDRSSFDRRFIQSLISIDFGLYDLASRRVRPLHDTANGVVFVKRVQDFHITFFIFSQTSQCRVNKWSNSGICHERWFVVHANARFCSLAMIICMHIWI
jgi:hypothetical protein